MVVRLTVGLAWGMVLLAALAGHAGDLSWTTDELFGETGRGRNELKAPVDVAFTRDGSLAVLDRDREAVVLFAASGRWLRTLGGTRGQGELDLRRPTGLACDPDDRLWVVDSGNHRLVVADLEGKVLRTIGSLGSSDGRFRHPTDVILDGRGRVYVADSGNERVQVLTAEGTFLAAWERRTGGRRDHLGEPVALAYTDQGRGGIWVLSRGWTRLERFDRDGEWEESLEVPAGEEGPPQPVHVEVDPAFYRMFISDATRGRILVLDRRGRPLSEVGLAEGRLDPGGLAVSRSMDLYATDAAGARLVKFKTR